MVPRDGSHLDSSDRSLILDYRLIPTCVVARHFLSAATSENLVITTMELQQCISCLLNSLYSRKSERLLLQAKARGVVYRN